MPSRAKDQIAMDERVEDEPAIEAALNQRLQAHDNVAEANRVYKRADDAARVALSAIEIPEDEAVRIGRFRITRTISEAKPVSYTTVAGKEKIQIDLVPDKG